MKIALVVSVKDIAGMGMKEALLATKQFEKTTLLVKAPFDADAVYRFAKNQTAYLYTLSCDTIHAEDLDKQIDADLFLFLTRHQGAAGIPSLSAHPIGNFGAAEYGGKDGTLVPAPANYIRHALDLMEKHKGALPYEIIQEATHHGPYLEKPTLFLEIGSTEKEWKDPEAVKVQVAVILDFITTTPRQYRPAIGFGGQHTCSNFMKVMKKTDIAFGHIAAKYAVPAVTEGLIEEMIEKTVPSPLSEGKLLIVLDWKGLGTGKQHLLDQFTKLGYEYKLTEDF